MSDVRLSEPIELTDADLDAVSGAYSVPQFGGQVTLGGSGGPTAYTGKITVNSITANITFAEDCSGYYGVVNTGRLQPGMKVHNSPGRPRTPFFTCEKGLGDLAGLRPARITEAPLR